MYETAWSGLSVTQAFGTRGDRITQQYGVASISCVRDYPGSRRRFAEMFPQDPMHDFGEGVAGWFLLEFFFAYFHQHPAAQRRFLLLYGEMRKSVHGFDLPPLDDFAFARIHRRQTLMLSGTVN